jgi:general secretion pathway protein G
MPRLSATPTAAALRQRIGRGWTLIELMMIVGLIGVLAAVALPAYSNHRDKIDRAAVARDFALITMMIQDYRLERGSFPPSLATVGMGGRTDPWGHAYQYYDVEANGRGGARKDHALNPINTDFDLYSVGKDGVTKKQVSQRDSLDDVIRGRNGAFIGLAADF